MYINSFTKVSSEKMKACITAGKQFVNKRIIQPPIIEKRRKILSGNEKIVISSNCTGGVICHDWGQPFLSPTINLFMMPDDFIKFSGNILEYLEIETLVQTENTRGDYPVGILKDITIYFVHYKDFREATDKWIERAKRCKAAIKEGREIILMCTNQNGFTVENYHQYCKIPYKKMLLTDKKYGEEESVEILVSANQEELRQGVNPIDHIFFFKGLSGHRRYEDYFNYGKFIM